MNALSLEFESFVQNAWNHKQKSDDIIAVIKKLVLLAVLFYFTAIYAPQIAWFGIVYFVLFATVLVYLSLFGMRRYSSLRILTMVFSILLFIGAIHCINTI